MLKRLIVLIFFHLLRLSLFGGISILPVEYSHLKIDPNQCSWSFANIKQYQQLHYIVPSINENTVIELERFTESDTLEIIDAKGAKVDFQLLRFSKDKWIISSIYGSDQFAGSDCIITIKNGANFSDFPFNRRFIRILSINELLEKEQYQLFFRGWMVGSTFLLLSIAFIFAKRLKNDLLLRFTNILAVIFLTYLYTYSNIIQLNHHFFNVGIIFFNAIFLIAAIRYNEYVRQLDKGLRNFSLTLNWKLIFIVLSLVVLIVVAFHFIYWVGLIILVLQVFSLLIFLLLNILDSFYFKWYNQIMVILLGITQMFFIVSLYFGDESLSFNASIILNLELIVASLLTAKVVISELNENKVLNQHNLQMQVQLGLIHLDSVENERKRIFQELNDDILFQLHALNKHLIPPKNEKRTADIQNLEPKFFSELEKLLKRLRKYTYQLFPPHMSHLSLYDVLSREIGLISDLSSKENEKWQLIWVSSEKTDNLNIETKVILYRLFQLYINQPFESASNPYVEVYFSRSNQTITYQFQSNVQFLNLKGYELDQRFSLYLRILKAQFEQIPYKNVWKFEFELKENQKR